LLLTLFFNLLLLLAFHSEELSNLDQFNENVRVDAYLHSVAELRDQLESRVLARQQLLPELGVRDGIFLVLFDNQEVKSELLNNVSEYFIHLISLMGFPYVICVSVHEGDVSYLKLVAFLDSTVHCLMIVYGEVNLVILVTHEA